MELRRKNLSVDEKRKWHAKWYRAHRHGVKITSNNHGIIDYEKFDYCPICDAVVSRQNDYFYCPCCHTRLKKKLFSVNTIFLDLAFYILLTTLIILVT